MTVYLICGVPGSGKTWVCEQLTDRFFYLPHDQHHQHHTEAIMNALRKQDKPVITECPFGERLLRQELEVLGVTVRPYFVIEPQAVVLRRYREREGRNPGQAVLTRAASILTRANEWRAPRGGSKELLEQLKNI